MVNVYTFGMMIFFQALLPFWTVAVLVAELLTLLRIIMGDLLQVRTGIDY